MAGAYTVNVELGSDYMTIRDPAGNSVFGPAGLATTRAGSPAQIRSLADSLLRSQGWERISRWDSDGRSFYASVERAAAQFKASHETGDQ